jgi:hypothetical protein
VDQLPILYWKRKGTSHGCSVNSFLIILADSIKVAQEGYEKFVSKLADKDYESPLK